LFSNREYASIGELIDVQTDVQHLPNDVTSRHFAASDTSLNH
jgi:hypothetical protein